MSGSAARRSCQTKAASSATPTTASPTIVAEPQAYSLPPQVVTRIRAARRRRRAAPRRDSRSGGVLRTTCRCSRSATIDDGDRADRQVDVEDPAPREVVDEEAAEQRPGDRRDGEHRADQAHVATALPRRDDVGDDRLRADHQAAGADALERAERDQLLHRLAEPGEHRAGEEDQDRGQEDGLAPVHVAELAVDRRRDRRREQVRR